jgi:Secretion system C-terminal sorting domain
MKKLLLAIVLLLAAVITKANNYYVTTAADTGAGSLRVMVDSANTHSGLDSIVLNLTAHDTIYLGSALPVISDSLVIAGLPCQNPTISGLGQIFSKSPVSVADSTIFLSLNYLNVFNCHTTGGQASGAVNGGQLVINYCFFYGNTYNQSAGNPSAGALYAQSVWAYNCSFSNDSCFSLQYSGGAVSAEKVHLFNCTFYSNYSADYGGAVNAHTFEIQNCTIAGNHAGNGGGLYSNYPQGNTTIANSIIWGNTVSNTDSSFAGFDFNGSSNISGGCNILQFTSAEDSFLTVVSDISGVNPQFLGFGYYSGCVPVLPIACGSVAQNHATCNGATATDAQGIIAQGVRDAGAFEITAPHLYSDSLDSIQPGTMADLYNYFNTTGLTIQWPNGLTDSTAAMVDTGAYTVIGTNFLGCSDTATVTIIYASDTTTGIAKSAPGNTLHLYPNPASNLVTLTWRGKNNPVLTLKITDMIGRVVYAQNIDGAPEKFTLPVTNLSPGAYYVSLTNSTQNAWGTKLVVMEK